ncbi:MAG: hypothetical protein AVDCRST_MAG08-3591, partial [uncultured Acetobacteraceae bacterium]
WPLQMSGRIGRCSPPCSGSLSATVGASLSRTAVSWWRTGARRAAWWCCPRRCWGTRARLGGVSREGRKASSCATPRCATESRYGWWPP